MTDRTMDHPGIDELPFDVVYRVISFMDPLDIRRLEEVSRRWREISRNRLIWTAAYRSSDLPVPNVPWDTTPTCELQRLLCKAARIEAACTSGEVKPVLRCSIEECGVDLFQSVMLDLVKGRWLVTGRANYVRCYDLQAPDPSASPVTWQAIAGVRMAESVCHACLDEDALLYAYIGTQDSITVLKLSLDPSRPTAFRCIRRLEWHCDDIYDELEGAAQVLSLNDRFLLACEFYGGHGEDHATLFSLYTRNKYKISVHQRTSWSGLSWLLCNPILTSTHVWFCYVRQSRRGDTESAYVHVEAFTLPCEPAWRNASQFLSMTPNQTFRLKCFHMNDHIPTIQTQGRSLHLLSTNVPPDAAAHTLRFLSCGPNAPAEIFEFSLLEPPNRRTPGSVAVHKFQTFPESVVLPSYPTPCVYSARGTSFLIFREDRKLKLWRLRPRTGTDDLLKLEPCDILIPRRLISSVKDQVAFDAGTGKLCANVTLHRGGPREPCPLINVYDLVSSDMSMRGM